MKVIKRTLRTSIAMHAAARRCLVLMQQAKLRIMLGCEMPSIR